MSLIDEIFPAGSATATIKYERIKNEAIRMGREMKLNHVPDAEISNKTTNYLLNQIFELCHQVENLKRQVK